MKYYEVAPLRVIRGAQQTFTYQAEDELPRGQLVIVSLGSQRHVGLVITRTNRPTYDTKLIDSVLDTPPLTDALVETALWMSEYYATHLATVLQTLLPAGLTKKRRNATHAPHTTPVRKRTNFVLNADQSSAINQLKAMRTGTTILHGITGSGKTAVYIEYIRTVLAQGRSAIVLVPEIALTSQLVAEFNVHFGHIIVTHSHQTEAERHRAWLSAIRATKPTVVIGPRSALFMPLRDIGCIVIDEAHEPSYNQDKSPRYSALRTASVLAAHHHGIVIQGSATPLVSEYYLASERKGTVLTLSSSANSKARKPHVKVIASTDRTSFTEHRFLSDKLIAEMRKTVERGEQVLIFHNRRGSAVSTLCENCGWMAMCPRCNVPYTLHGDLHTLQCHICSLRERVPTSCPECQSTDILHKGIGTKLIESELRRLFPKHTIARFDGDTEHEATLERQYQELYDGKISIIIGTQVVAKGLDLPLLRTVGVIQADAGLTLPDFAAPERTFQLLAQVVGRVGRSERPTTIIVQTYQPDADAVQFGIAQNYAAFYATELARRRKALFPPFTYLLKLTCAYKTEPAAIRNAQQLALRIRKEYPTVSVLGPTPAFYERQRDTYRWQLTVKSSSRKPLVAIAASLPNAHWQFGLDPHSLL